MAGGVLYTDKQLETIEKNNDILSDIVKVTHEKFSRNKDNRDARLLIEAINSSNESIHKHAANVAKMEQAKNNDDTLDMVAGLLMQLSSKSSILPIQKIDTLNTNIIIPSDIVDGELFIGSGSLEITDLKKEED